MTEHETQSAILDLIRLRGGVATRVNSGSAVFKRDGVTNVIRGADKGTADIIACYKGRYLAIEVKHGRNKPTQDQERFLDKVVESGGISVVAYDTYNLDPVLDAIDKMPRISVDIEPMEEK